MKNSYFFSFLYEIAYPNTCGVPYINNCKKYQTLILINFGVLSGWYLVLIKEDTQDDNLTSDGDILNFKNLSSKLIGAIFMLL